MVLSVYMYFEPTQEFYVPNVLGLTKLLIHSWMRMVTANH